MSHVTDFQIIYTGIFTEADFHFEVLPGKRSYKAATRKLINAAWQDAKLNPNLDIFNGKVISLISSAVTTGKETGRNRIFLKVQETDYKSFYGTNVCNPGVISKPELANALSVCAVVETVEGTVFAGLRNERLAETSGVWHVPGGTLSAAINPIDFMKQELAEELNVSEEDIQSSLCLGMAENLLMKKPEFLCYFHLNLNEWQLSDKLLNAPDKDEHTEFVFIPMEELQDFTEIHSFAPIGRAAVQLYLDYLRSLG